MMLTTYDEALAKIEFYKTHPEYMPFVGDKYAKFRILHIGESHYIGQKWTAPEDEYPIEYFLNWQNDHCADLYAKYGEWYTTRRVIDNYLIGERRKGHGIFTAMIKVFNKVYLGRENVHISIEEGQNYHYLAFMNFFQMPALYDGVKYWKSLVLSADKTNNPEAAGNIYNKLEKLSAEVVDAVIEVLKPEVVVFTSKAAIDAYNRLGKYRSEPFIIPSIHPGCSWWNRPLPRFNGKTGKQQLEDALTERLKEINR